jgi:hypothetical protein
VLLALGACGRAAVEDAGAPDAAAPAVASAAPPAPPPPEALIEPSRIELEGHDEACVDPPALEDGFYELAPLGTGPKLAATLPSHLAGRTVTVWREPRADVTAPRLSSVSVANDVFTLSGHVASGHDPMRRVLVLCGRAVEAESTGSDATPATRSVQFRRFGRPLAERARKSLGAELVERRRLDDGLHLRFSAAEHARGAPLAIELALENRGSETIVVRKGVGDERFSFEIERGGRTVVKSKPPGRLAGNGHVGIADLAPGARQTFSFEVAVGPGLDEAGEYVVRCRFRLELATPRDAPRAETWEGTATQTIPMITR